MQKTNKIKLTTNLKLIMCTNYQKLEESWLKDNHSCFQNEIMKCKINMKSKVLEHVFPPSLTLTISKYNNHN